MPEPPSYIVPSERREYAEKSVDQARKAFETFIGAAQKAMNEADTKPKIVQGGTHAIGDKAVNFAEQNIRSAFEYASKVVRVNDMQELMMLQSEYVRAQSQITDEWLRVISVDSDVKVKAMTAHTLDEDGTFTEGEWLDVKAIALDLLGKGLYTPEEQSKYVHEKLAKIVDLQ